MISLPTGVRLRQADHDHLRDDLVGDGDQVVSGVVATDQAADVVLDTGVVEAGRE